jgi:hypothetical protein
MDRDNQEAHLECRLKQLESSLIWRVESRFIALAYAPVMMVVFGIRIWNVR